MKEITTITPNGIHYIDEEGNPQFLDFETCYQNFLMDMRKRMGVQYMGEHIEFYKTHKSVGFRHAFRKPLLLWFYTVPPTEFEFPTEESFWEIVSWIKKAGYRTTDGE